jgi:hypothetical protein
MQPILQQQELAGLVQTGNRLELITQVAVAVRSKAAERAELAEQVVAVQVGLVSRALQEQLIPEVVAEVAATTEQHLTQGLAALAL